MIYIFGDVFSIILLIIVLSAIIIRFSIFSGSYFKDIKNSGVICANHWWSGGGCIGLKQSNKVSFLITPERWYHRLIKKYGKTSEVQLYDEDFDRKYFISTSSPEAWKIAIKNGVVEELKAIFSLGIKYLYSNQEKIWVGISGIDVTEENLSRNKNYFDKYTRAMNGISNCLNKSFEQIPYNSRLVGAKQVYAHILSAVHVGILVFGILSIASYSNLWIYQSKDLYFSYHDYDFPYIADYAEMLVKAGFAGVFFVLLWGFLLLKIFRNTVWVGWIINDYVIFGIAGIMLASLPLVYEINARMYNSNTVYIQEVLEKKCKLICANKVRTGRSYFVKNNTIWEYSDDKCSPSERESVMQGEYIKNKRADCEIGVLFGYFIAIKNWKGDSEVKFSVDGGLFDKIKHGDKVKVPVNSGALGIEWINTKSVTVD